MDEQKKFILLIAEENLKEFKEEIGPEFPWEDCVIRYIPQEELDELCQDNS